MSITIAHGSIGRRGREIVSASSLTFEFGSCIGVVGLNGSGKSTWLSGLAGLLPGSSPQIRHGNLELTHFGLVLQHPSLPHWLTVSEALALLIRPTAPMTELAERWLLEPLLERKAGQLSKGETQFIAASATLEDKCVLRCFDEPFAALDLKRRRELIHGLVRVRSAEPSVTILTAQVSSDLYETCTHILMLKDGGLSMLGTVEDLSMHPTLDPRAAFEQRVVTFLGG